jgi:hypothetical protein
MARFSQSQMPGTRMANYEYELPPELIATHPALQRAESRLLVYHRATDRVEHRRLTLSGNCRPDSLVEPFKYGMVVPTGFEPVHRP